MKTVIEEEYLSVSQFEADLDNLRGVTTGVAHRTSTPRIQVRITIIPAADQLGPILRETKDDF